jgi:hypothetical protein
MNFRQAVDSVDELHQTTGCGKPAPHPPCPQYCCCYYDIKKRTTRRRTSLPLGSKAATYTATRSGAARIVVAGRSGWLSPRNPVYLGLSHLAMTN